MIGAVEIRRSHLLFVAMCLIWGTTWIAVKAGISVVPPCFFAGTRFVTAGTLMLGFLWWRGTPPRVARADAIRLAAVTLQMVSATYALLFWGALFVSSGLAAILDLAFMPVALLVIGRALGQERFTRARVIGIVLGVVGIVVLFGPKAAASHGAGGRMEVVGGGAIVLSALIYSWGSVLARPLMRQYSPVLISGATTFGGGLVLLLGSLTLEPGAAAAASGAWGWAAWAGWLFLVLCGSLAAFTIYLHLIGEWGTARAGSYAFVSPVFAVLLGVLVFSEKVHVSDFAGMALMLAGACLVLRAPAPAAGDAAYIRDSANS